MNRKNYQVFPIEDLQKGFSWPVAAFYTSAEAEGWVKAKYPKSGHMYKIIDVSYAGSK